MSLLTPTLSAPPPDRLPELEDHVDLPWGGRLHLRTSAGRAGSPGVLLVHGLGGSSLNWTSLAGALGDDVEAWAPDLPGYGESLPSTDGDHTVAGLARAAEVVGERLAERTGGPVHLVGNSLGGLVAVLLAASRPDLVRSLALLSPALPARRLPRDARYLALLSLPRVGELVMQRNRGRSAEVQARLSLRSVFSDLEAVPPERFAAAVRERARRMEQPYADEVFLSSLRSVVAEGLRLRAGAWSRAASLSVPTLVLYGGRDRLVHGAAAARWRRTLPSARLVLLPTTGHVPQMERPQLVASLLREHWAEVEGA